MTNFTPQSAIAGGLLIGGAAVMYRAFAGRFAGISGILRGAMLGDPDRPIDVMFVAGLLLGGALWLVAGKASSVVGVTHPLGMVAAGGVLVGFGTALGGGCTSGHGVCGLGRLSLRSLVAVLTFLAAGVVTVFVVNHVAAVR